MKEHESVRKPYVAGQFYQADPEALREEIENLIREAEDSGNLHSGREKPRALIMPHAGFMFSGATAVKTMSRTSGYKYKKAVIAAPSHSFPFRGLALSGCNCYSTPLGNVKIDTDAVQKLLASGNPLINQSNDAHNYEHALEVQLPILQSFHPDIEILPLVCGAISTVEARQLCGVLAEYWNPETLWIISSDFTHYGKSFRYVPFTEDVPGKLKLLDMGAIEKIGKLDLDGFEQYIKETDTTICGNCPIKLLLAMLLTESPPPTAELVEYTTSGHKTGDFSHCVSYAGLCFA